MIPNHSFLIQIKYITFAKYCKTLNSGQSKVPVNKIISKFYCCSNNYLSHAFNAFLECTFPAINNSDYFITGKMILDNFLLS